MEIGMEIGDTITTVIKQPSHFINPSLSSDLLKHSFNY